METQDKKRLRIGLQISNIDSGYRMDLFNAIEEECKKRNHDLLVFAGGRGGMVGFEYLQSTIYHHLIKSNIDSLIVSSEVFLRKEKENNTSIEDIEFAGIDDMESAGKEKLSDAEIDALVGQNNTMQRKKEQMLPKVSVIKTRFDIPQVVCDYKENFKTLIAHMINVHGCKMFNIITGRKGNTSTDDCLKFCLDVLSEFGIYVEENRIYSDVQDTVSGFNAMRYFYQKQLMPVDCIICLDDDMAIGVTSYAKTRGLSIPENLRLIGMGGITRARFNSVSISTVDERIALQSNTVLDAAEKLAQGNTVEKELHIPTRVLYRKSCGCIALDDSKTDYINAESEQMPYDAARLYTQSSEYFELEENIFLMRKFFTNINAALTLQKALEHLESFMPQLYVRSCALVLYEKKMVLDAEDDFILPSRASLMLLYDGIVARKESEETMRGKSFDPHKGILPEGTFSDRRRTLIVKSLFYDNALFGYVVYEPGKLHQALYDMAFSLVSGVLNSAILFTQQQAIEQHQRVMLKQLESSNTELTGRVYTDELTNVYNWRGLLNFGQQAIDLAMNRGQKGMVLYADMDGLKGINDTYGHDAGDIAIKTMADILKETFRTQDVVGRKGGDEFVVVAVGLTESLLPKIRERIKSFEAKWYEENQPPFHLGISFGGVSFDDGKDTNIENLLAAADKLLYEEKVQKHSRSSIKESVMQHE